MSPNEETIEDYLQALRDRDYRLARVCLLELSSTADIEDLIRRTHEMDPPR
jgi:hypothetical protein